MFDFTGVLTADEITAIYNGGVGDVGEPKFAITSPASITGAKGNPFLIRYQPKRLTDCPDIIPLSPIPF